MSDYIERQKAIRWVKTECNPYGKPTLDFESGKKVIEHLERMPSADVVPVEYGEWIGVPEIWGSFDSRYYCSKCGKDAIINNSERYVLSDYCPHCGAIMDNKRGNEND